MSGDSIDAVQSCREVVARLGGAIGAAVFDRHDEKMLAMETAASSPALVAERLEAVVRGALWHPSFASWRELLSSQAGFAATRGSAFELRVDWPDLCVVAFGSPSGKHTFAYGLAASSNFALARLELIAAAQEFDQR